MSVQRDQFTMLGGWVCLLMVTAALYRTCQLRDENDALRQRLDMVEAIPAPSVLAATSSTPTLDPTEAQQREMLMDQYLLVCRTFRRYGYWAIYFESAQVQIDVEKGLEGCRYWSFESGWPFQGPTE